MSRSEGELPAPPASTSSTANFRRDFHSTECMAKQKEATSSLSSQRSRCPSHSFSSAALDTDLIKDLPQPAPRAPSPPEVLCTP